MMVEKANECIKKGMRILSPAQGAQEPKESRKNRILTGIWMLHGFSGIAYILILLFIPNIWF